VKQHARPIQCHACSRVVSTDDGELVPRTLVCTVANTTLTFHLCVKCTTSGLESLDFIDYEALVEELLIRHRIAIRRAVGEEEGKAI